LKEIKSALLTKEKSKTRPAKPVKSIQWIDLSVERREPKRAAAAIPHK